MKSVPSTPTALPLVATTYLSSLVGCYSTLRTVVTKNNVTALERYKLPKTERDRASTVSACTLVHTYLRKIYNNSLNIFIGEKTRNFVEVEITS